MKLAAQLYTLRDFIKTPEDIKKTLEKVKKIGYNSVQFSAMGPIEPSLLKEYVDGIGLDVCATHTPFDRIINETEKVIEEHKLWNCDYIGLGAMAPEYRGSEEKTKNFLDILLPAANKIKDSGLKFVYHNHRFEFEKIGEYTIIEYMINNTQSDVFGILVDTYWAQAGGASPSSFIEKYSDRIDVIHLKDMCVIDDQGVIAEVGEGNMDWIQIGKSSKIANVKYAAVEQDICRRDPFESLEISFNNIKEMGICTI